VKDYRIKPSSKHRDISIDKKTIVIFLAIVIVFSSVFYLLRFSSIFKIKSFEIAGDISSEELKQSVRSAILENNLGAKIFGEDNILFWDNVDFEKIYKKFPKVSNITISKNIFKGNVIAKINGKEKNAAWCLAERDECFWIDSTGFISNTAPSFQGKIVKVVRDSTPERDLNIGDRVLDQEGAINLDKIFMLLSELKIDVREFKIDDIKYREIKTLVDNGPEIQFSLDFDPGFSKNALKGLTASLDWQKMRYIDLRVENRIYYSR